MSGKPVSPSNKTLHIAMWFCIAVCVLTVFWGQSGVTVTQIIGSLLFSSFLAGPFLLLYYGGRRFTAFWMRWLLVAAMLLALSFWLLIFLLSFVFTERIDAQVGLIFVFGPIYMAIGSGLVLIALDVLDLVLKKLKS